MGDTKKKPGRESKYVLDIDAAVGAGAVVSAKELSAKGTDGKTYTQMTKEIVFKKLNQVLAFLSGSEEHLCELFSKRVANPMLQSADRQKLAVASEGPERAIKDMAESLVEGGAFETVDEAREFAISRLKSRGVIPDTYGQEVDEKVAS